MSSNTLHFLPLDRNIIWKSAVGPVISLYVEFISFAQKVAVDFC